MTTTLFILGGLIGLLVLAGLLSSKELMIEKEIVIRIPSRDLFDFLRYVKNHDQFSVWAMMVPAGNKTYRGTDGQVGFVYAWDSSNKSAGAGEQEIKNIEEGKSLEHELRFLRPSPGVARSVITLSAADGGQTRVHWSFYTEMAFPMRIMKPVMKSFLAKNTQKSLENLKALLDK